MRIIVVILIFAMTTSVFASQEVAISKTKDLMSIMKPGRLDTPQLPQSMMSIWNELKGKMLYVYENLTKPFIKNRRDVCVWKICSRPLIDSRKSNDAKY
jgi:hypothetical protein